MNGVATPMMNGNGYSLSAVDITRQTSVSSGSHYSYNDIPPPPPLMPKPPREYMEETLQEDVNLAAQIKAVDKQHEQGYPPNGVYPSVPYANGAAVGVGVGLELRPFTPFNPAIDSSPISLIVPPPPPLPPKVGIDDR